MKCFRSDSDGIAALVCVAVSYKLDEIFIRIISAFKVNHFKRRDSQYLIRKSYNLLIYASIPEIATEIKKIFLISDALKLTVASVKRKIKCRNVSLHVRFVKCRKHLQKPLSLNSNSIYDINYSDVIIGTDIKTASAS